MVSESLRELSRGPFEGRFGCGCCAFQVWRPLAWAPLEACAQHEEEFLSGYESDDSRSLEAREGW